MEPLTPIVEYAITLDLKWFPIANVNLPMQVWISTDDGKAFRSSYNGLVTLNFLATWAVTCMESRPGETSVQMVPSQVL